MLENGIIVGLGLLFSLGKMSWPWKLRVLSSPLIVDAIVFIGLVLLHWGTFSGVMVATIGALMASMVLSLGRWFVGHYHKGQYVPGKFDVSSRLPPK